MEVMLRFISQSSVPFCNTLAKHVLMHTYFGLDLECAFQTEKITSVAEVREFQCTIADILIVVVPLRIGEVESMYFNC